MPEEKDQVRWKDAPMHPLHQLQDRMHLHPRGEEEAASERVRHTCSALDCTPWLTRHSAKYIEGLENRLARMESLMRLSGVLPNDDDGSTDLATLERRLEARAGRSTTPRTSLDERRTSAAPNGQSTTAGTPMQPIIPSPDSGTTTPEPERPAKKGEKEEDALAEMMCSLVTTNCGETRYIGQW